MIRDKNLQRMELQFYIKNVARCVGIVDFISKRRQDHQCNTIIQYETFFEYNLSTKYIKFKQESDLQNKTEKSTSSTNILCVYSLPLFLPTLSFELQIRNLNCDPNIQQDNIIPFTLNIKYKYFLDIVYL